MARPKISKVHVLDVAVACLKESKNRNPILIEDMEKIAAEYKGRERVQDAHKERERVKAQRALWAALPEFGPGAVAADDLKKAMVDRALRLLDSGECEACDALLEFVPEADAEAILKEYFPDDD